MPKITLWSCLRDALNSYNDGQLFSRKQILYKIKEAYPDVLSESSFDLYRLMLTRIKVLEWISKGVYKKLQHFPESLTTSKAHKLEIHYQWEKDTWADWFVDNIEDRIKLL